MAQPLITVRGLEHTYRVDTPEAVPALRGVDLDIYPGECLAVIGGNGSGKSTLAKHLNALLRPTAGEVHVGGLDTRDPEAVWAIRQQVGMIFEDPDDQLVAAVVEEDVAFGCENLGLPPPEIRRRVDRALRLVGLDHLRRRPPHLLSGGQKQRVAIAGVLAMQPRCLVLDEATSMLDPQGQREVMETALRLCRARGSPSCSSPTPWTRPPSPTGSWCSPRGGWPSRALRRTSSPERTSSGPCGSSLPTSPAWPGCWSGTGCRCPPAC